MSDISNDQTTEVKKHGRIAIASLVFGMLGIHLANLIPLISLPVTITGLVLGIKGNNPDNRKLATIGIFLSVIGLIAGTLLLIIEIID